MEPLLRRHVGERRVVALDLPGFGASDKPDRRCAPQDMQRAIVAVIDWIGGATPIDMVALSLGCEFAAEAVLQRPHRVRSLALISPTGVERKRAGEPWQDGRTREQAWLRSVLRDTPIGSGLYRLLTTRASMRWFLGRTWGGRHFDQRLLEQGRMCSRRPGAHHAPLDFVSGALFTRGIVERYRQLPVPLWVCHGKRGSFTDFDAFPQRSDSGLHIERTVMASGAMPHFELPAAFDAAYRHFVRQLGGVVPVPPPTPDVVPTPQPAPPPPQIPPEIIDPPLTPTPPPPVTDPAPPERQPSVGIAFQDR